MGKKGGGTWGREEKEGLVDWNDMEKWREYSGRQKRGETETQRARAIHTL